MLGNKIKTVFFTSRLAEIKQSDNRQWGFFCFVFLRSGCLLNAFEVPGVLIVTNRVEGKIVRREKSSAEKLYRSQLQADLQ